MAQSSADEHVVVLGFRPERIGCDKMDALLWKIHSTDVAARATLLSVSDDLHGKACAYDV